MSTTSMHARHRFGRKAVVGSALAAAAVTGTVAFSQPASAASTWAGLRQCESGGNYSINTGNGFYGAYQFDLQTWHGLGYSGLPSDASPATQDAAAQKLFSERGSQPWPACGQGLQGGSTSSGSTAAATTTTRTTTSTHVTYRPATSAAPFFTTALVGQKRADVRAWQTQINKLGYHITIDGQYGPQSAAAARQFQIARHLQVDGIVGPETWRATFG